MGFSKDQQPAKKSPNKAGKKAVSQVYKTMDTVYPRKEAEKDLERVGGD